MSLLIIYYIIYVCRLPWLPTSLVFIHVLSRHCVIFTKGIIVELLSKFLTTLFYTASLSVHSYTVTVSIERHDVVRGSHVAVVMLLLMMVLMLCRLGAVTMTTAVEDRTTRGRAVFVEHCSCPSQYTGLSCEVWAVIAAFSSTDLWCTAWCTCLEEETIST